MSLKDWHDNLKSGQHILTRYRDGLYVFTFYHRLITYKEITFEDWLRGVDCAEFIIIFN